MSIKSFLHTALVLGRVSNLPTVWSNLLAGWFLNRGEFHPATLALLLAGGSFLYIGGMYLNDFCDADFDARYCPQRPIPAGQISRRSVGGIGVLWLIAGLACLVRLGASVAGIALVLIGAIVLYDFRHKNVSWAPLAMAACRFLLYPLGALAATGPLGRVRLEPPIAVGLGALALASYVAGITYLARGESRPGKPARWALVLLLLPVALAFVAPDREASLLAALLLLSWMAWLLIPLWRGTNRSIGRVVAGLLAGIVLVDLIAVAPLLGLAAAGFLVFFALALLLQRVVPAT